MALRDCLEVTSHQLVQLELDILSLIGFTEESDDNFMAWDILKLPRGGEKLVFPNLQ